MSKITNVGATSPTVSKQPVESADEPNQQSVKPPSQEGSESQSSGAARVGSRDVGRRVVEHLLEGQTRQADLSSQLPVNRDLHTHGRQEPSVFQSPIRLENPPETPIGTTGETVPASPEDARMSGTHGALPNQQMQEYFNHRAPHHDLIAAGRYGEASRRYGQLAQQADRSGDISMGSTHMHVAEQLEMTDRMRRAGVRNLTFPPTDRNVDDYFSSLRREPASRVANEFERYTRAFFVHHGVRGTIEYDAETHRVNRAPLRNSCPGGLGRHNLVASDTRRPPDDRL